MKNPGDFDIGADIKMGIIEVSEKFKLASPGPGFEINFADHFPSFVQLELKLT